MELKENKRGKWLFENPVDYFNKNHPDDGLALLLKDKSILPLGLGKYGQVGSPAGNICFEYSNGYLKVNEFNSLGLEVGALYSPFELLRKIMCGNNFYAAIKYVGHNYMDMENEYIRVGVKYFKQTVFVDRAGILRKKLSLWAKEEIKEDLGKNGMEYVDKYDMFIMEPNNINYSSVVDGNYNMYSKFPHVPKPYKDPKQISWSIIFIKHIFGEQYELGLRYMKVLYEFPKQALPILVLVSEDRSTGKSTFVDWVNIIFGDNMVIINPQDISSSFNESYAVKNIIAIEESRFDSVQATEKLKALATLKNITINAKFQNPYTVPFAGKLIITSNDESKFSKVDEKEIRYWTRQIPQIKVSNHAILKSLTEEIPYFLDYLSTQVPEIDFTRSRQIFTPEEIETDALRTVKKESRTGLHKELVELFEDWMLNNPSCEYLHFVPKDIKDFWFDKNSNFSIYYINHVLSKEMYLDRTDTAKRYTPFFSIDGFAKEKRGHFYEIPNKYFDGVHTLNSNDEPKGECPF